MSELSAGFDAVFRALDCPAYREAIAESSRHDPLPGWVVPFSFVTGSDLDRVATAAHMDSSSSFADLGCGLGGTVLWLTQRTGASGVGVDFSAAAVGLAGTRAQELGLAKKARFVASDMAASGLPAESFDAVTSIDAIPFAPPDAIAGEIARLLRPGGVAALWAFVAEGSPRPTVVNDYRSYFERAGLRVETHEEMHGWSQRRSGFYNALLARAADLRHQMGEEIAGMLLAEASDPPDNRRVFIAATKIA